jgi:uncharacterized membrane protein YfcA
LVVVVMVQAGPGIDFGLTAVPAVGLLDPQLVPAPALFVAMLAAAWRAWTERGAISWNEVGTGMVGRIAGVAAAAVLLARITDRQAFALVFGLLVLPTVVVSAHARASPSHAPIPSRSRACPG